jgi:hypothetical protein
MSKLVEYLFFSGFLDHLGTINGKDEDKTDSFATVGVVRCTRSGQQRFSLVKRERRESQRVACTPDQ